jgi:hypothetical protein
VAKYIACLSRGITWVEIASGREPQGFFGRHGLFDPRIDVGEGADGAGDRGRPQLPCALRPAVAWLRVELGIGLGHLQAERHQVLRECRG